MNNIAKVAKYVRKQPGTIPSKVLLELAVALETGAPFSFNRIYDLDHNEFKLAMGMIEDWRLDHYFMSKLHLLDYAEFTESIATR